MVLPKKSQFGTPNPDPWYGFTENKENFSEHAKQFTIYKTFLPSTIGG
jgi:hypothetical protein